MIRLIALIFLIAPLAACGADGDPVPPSEASEDDRRKR